METYDAVVIGGGPAGSAAARTLAARKLSCCLIDKSVFPRDKLCGGGVTLRSKRAFETIFGRRWDDSLFLRTDAFAFCLRGRVLEKITGHSVMHATSRVAFDAYLLGLAREAGVATRLGCKPQSIDLEGRRIVLDTGEEIGFRYLVGADGVNSQVARQLYGASFDPATIGFAMEIEVPRADMPGQDNTAEIDFSGARWGYGWCFPKQRSFTLGVGGVHRMNPDLREQFARYLQGKGLDIANYRVKGQFLPWGDVRQQPGRRHVLLCGDAAGTVDPITGEGIAYALQSGHAAALAIAGAHAQSSDDALAFYRSLFSPMARSIRQARRWRRLVFPRPVFALFSRAFAEAGTLQRGFLDIMDGRREYSDLGRIFRAQVVLGLRRLGRAAAGRAGLR